MKFLILAAVPLILFHPCTSLGDYPVPRPDAASVLSVHIIRLGDADDVGNIPFAAVIENTSDAEWRIPLDLAKWVSLDHRRGKLISSNSCARRVETWQGETIRLGSGRLYGVRVTTSVGDETSAVRARVEFPRDAAGHGIPMNSATSKWISVD